MRLQNNFVCERLLALSFVKEMFCAGASSFGFSSCCAFRFGGTQILKKKNEKEEQI